MPVPASASITVTPCPRSTVARTAAACSAVSGAVGRCDRALGERGLDDAGSLARAADRRGDQPPLALHQLGGRHLARLGRDHVRALGEALGLRAHLADQSALPRRGRELLQHRALVEGVRALGQTLGARQVIAERLLVDCVALGQAVARAAPGRLEQLGELVAAEPELAGAGPHLLAPGVGLHAVLLAIARGERRALAPRPCYPRPIPPACGLAQHLLAAL